MSHQNETFHEIVWFTLAASGAAMALIPCWVVMGRPAQDDIAALLLFAIPFAFWLAFQGCKSLLCRVRDFNKWVSHGYDGWSAAAPERAQRRAARKSQRVADRSVRRQQLETERERDHVQRQVTRARREVEVFYYQHRNALHDACPPALLRSQINASIPADASSQQAWSAAKELIASLQPLVQEHDRREEQRRRSETARTRRLSDLDRQIAQLHQEIKNVRRSPLDSTITEEEVYALEQRIRQLEEQKEMLCTSRADDDS